MDDDALDIYGDLSVGDLETDKTAAPLENDDDLLYGDLDNEEGGGKHHHHQHREGDEDLILNLYEVGDKDEEEDTDKGNGRIRGLERERERYSPLSDETARQTPKEEQMARYAHQEDVEPRARPERLAQQQQQPLGVSQPDVAGSQDVPAVIISSLTWWTTDKDLEDIINHAGVGKIKQIKFYENKQNGRSKGYAIVAFHDVEAARQAKERLHGQMIHHKPCVVNFAPRHTLDELNNMGKKAKPAGLQQAPPGRQPMPRQMAANAPAPQPQRAPRNFPPGGRGFMPGPGPYGHEGPGPMAPGHFMPFPVPPGMGRGGRGIMGHAPHPPYMIPGAHINPAFLNQYDQHDDMPYRRPDHPVREDRDHERDRERERERERDRDRGSVRAPESRGPADRERVRERERPREGGRERGRGSEWDRDRGHDKSDYERDFRDRGHGRTDRDRSTETAERDRGRETTDTDRSRETAERDRSRETTERGRSRETADRGRSRETTDRGRSRERSRGGGQSEGDSRGMKRERDEPHPHPSDKGKRRRGDSS